MDKIQELIEFFTRKEGHQNNFFCFYKSVYAYNRTAGIMIPKQLFPTCKCNSINDESEILVRISERLVRIFDYPDRNCTAILSAKELREELNEKALVRAKEKCNNCDGLGEVTCSHCEHVSTCEKCGGDCEVDSQSGFEYNPDYVRKIEGVDFSANVLEHVILTAEAVGTDIELIYMKKNTPCIFRVGEITVCLMPRFQG